MDDKQDVCDLRVWGFRGAQRSSAQEKIPEILTTSSIYLQVIRQIQDVLECIFILDHGGEGAHGSTTHTCLRSPYPREDTAPSLHPLQS